MKKVIAPEVGSSPARARRAAYRAIGEGDATGSIPRDAPFDETVLGKPAAAHLLRITAPIAVIDDRSRACSQPPIYADRSSALSVVYTFESDANDRTEKAEASRNAVNITRNLFIYVVSPRDLTDYSDRGVVKVDNPAGIVIYLSCVRITKTESSVPSWILKREK